MVRMNEEQNMPNRSTIDGLHGAASYARPGHTNCERETRFYNDTPMKAIVGSARTGRRGTCDS